MWIRGNRGFTLLEVMIALAIIGISFIGLLGLRNRDISLAGYSRDLMQATLLTRRKMTEIELAGFPDLGEQSGQFQEGEQLSRFKWKEKVLAPELSPTLVSLVREVHVTVSWSDEKEHIEMAMYLFNGR